MIPLHAIPLKKEENGEAKGESQTSDPTVTSSITSKTFSKVAMKESYLPLIRHLLPSYLSSFLSGFANSVMDTLAYHFTSSKFSKLDDKQFWDPSLSWTNKYKNGDPKQGDKFFLSSTSFVFMTDGWHLAKMFYIFFQLVTVLATTHFFARFVKMQIGKGIVINRGKMIIYYLFMFITIKLAQNCGFTLFWDYIWPL